MRSARQAKGAKCEYPVTLARGVADTCGRAAVWTTDDLKEIHHLCADHCNEALQMNDFEVDHVTPCDERDCPEAGEWEADSGRAYCREHSRRVA